MSHERLIQSQNTFETIDPLIRLAQEYIAGGKNDSARRVVDDIQRWLRNEVDFWQNVENSELEEAARDYEIRKSLNDKEAVKNVD